MDWFGEREAKMETQDKVDSENDEEKMEDECLWPYLEELFMHRGRKGHSVALHQGQAARWREEES